MAHVYFGDWRPRSSLFLSAIGPSKEKKLTYGTDWAHSMRYVFWFLEWWNRYKIMRAFYWVPLQYLNGLGNVLGRLFLGTSKKYQDKVQKSLQALYPSHLSSRRIHSLVHAHSSYLGKLVLVFLMGIQARFPPPETSFITFERMDRLAAALAQHKGVILTITHLGELTQAIWGIAKLPQKYPIAIVAYVPHMGIYSYYNQPEYDHVYLYASTSFDRVSRRLEWHLRQNHLVIIYADFGTARQLRVPFWKNKYPYLIHTPQSYVRLHRTTGAVLLPAINIPDGVIGKTRLIFLDNSKLELLSKKFWNSPSKTFHGEIGTEMNRILNPYLVQYAHVWEQLPELATTRLADGLQFSANLSIGEVLHAIFLKMVEILDESYEPSRRDNDLKNTLEAYKIRLYEILGDRMRFPWKECVNDIDLSLLSGCGEIRKLIKFIELNILSEIAKIDKHIEMLLTELAVQIHDLSNNLAC